MNIQILVPITIIKKLKEDLFLKKGPNDKITFVDTRKDTRKYSDIIRKSDYSYYIILHPNFNLMNNNYIYTVRSEMENVDNSNILVYSDKKEENHTNLLNSKNSLICFSKQNFDIEVKRFNNTLLYMQYIISCFDNKKYLYAPDYEEMEMSTGSNELTSVKKESHKRPANKKASIKKENKTNDKSPPKIRSKGDKPQILFITDVKGWAWWLKSEYLKKYLSDEFNIDMVNRIGQGKEPIDTNKYDLYFTFGHGFVRTISKAPFNRRITGVTAHRSLNTIKGNIKKAYAAHANSVLLLNELKTIHNNCYYVPNGVDTEKFYPKKESDIFKRDYINIGHVGKVSKMKGQKEIIEPVIKKLKERGNKVNYISHYNNYQNKIPHDQMPDLYQDMDLFMVASKEDATPNPFSEASACGVPTVGNQIGNLPEFITQGVNGYIVENPTIGNYVKTIESLSKEHLVEMGKNARQTAETEWTWEIQAENYRYMLKNILEINEKDNEEI